MASSKITSLPEDLAPASGDYLVTVDVSDTTQAPTGTNKKVKVSSLLAGVSSGGGAVSSVAGRTGAVVLAESDVAGLVADLAAKAANGAVVHKVGDEAIDGVKTFTSPIVGTITGNATAAQGAKADTALQSAVTSVGLTTPGVLFSVSGSPVTGSGTLAMALVAQAANAVLAGPTSGANAAPTMRALVAGDIPALPYAPTASPTFTGTVTAPVRVATPRADADGATITLDFSASDFHSVTLGGNRTVAFTNATPGQVVRVELVQDATGGRSVTWPTVRWPGGTPPTLAATAGKADLVVVAVRADGTFAGATSIANY